MWLLLDSNWENIGLLFILTSGHTTHKNQQLLLRTVRTVFAELCIYFTCDEIRIGCG